MSLALLVKGSRGPLMGMDKGTFATKLVQVTKKRAPFSILKSELVIASEPDTLSRLKRTVDRLKEQKRHTCMSISDGEVEMHEFRLPRLPEGELANAIDWELRKIVPELDGYVYDTIIWPQTEDQLVQCFVVPEQRVRTAHDEISTIGLTPSILETESSSLCALVKILSPHIPLDRISIIDLGYSSYRLIYIHEGRVVLTRPLYFGVASLYRQFSLEARMEPAEVHSFVLQMEQCAPENYNSSQSQLLRLFQESLYTLCEEFHRTEQFLKEQKAFEPAQKIYLAGGGACIPPALEYMRQHLIEDIELLNPFRDFSQMPHGVPSQSGSVWACAVGLSLREGE